MCEAGNIDETTRKLLFELSNEDRMGILQELKGKRLKLSQLARSQDIHVSEASRHLQRLGDVGLVRRDGDGQYRLTHYGELVLSQLNSIEALSKNAVYFSQCDTSVLPHEFISRLGELAEGKANNNIADDLNELDEAFKGAERFIWIMTAQILQTTVPHITAKFKMGVEVRNIAPKEVYLSGEGAFLTETLLSNSSRELDKVEIMLLVTEHVAGFSLPSLDNNKFIHALIGNDEKFRKWCEDLFKYYWEKARPLAQ